MKRFRFSLQSLKIVREARELRAREVFGAAVRVVNAADAHLSTTRREKADFERTLLAERGSSFRPADQAAFLQAHRRLITREQEAVVALQRATAERESRRAEWLNSRRDLRLIENLEDGARRTHRAAEDREAQLLLDDHTNAAAARLAAGPA